MAINIGTNAQFTTTNMKPESGEQLDALWGQNIADNTGYLFYKSEPVQGLSFRFAGTSPTPQASVLRGTTYFVKRPGHNQLVGSWVFRGSCNVTASLIGSFYVNGNLVKGTTITTTTEQILSGSLVFNTSSLTDNQIYAISGRLQIPGANSISTDLDLTVWSTP